MAKLTYEEKNEDKYKKVIIFDIDCLMIDSEIYNEYVRKLHLLRYDNFTR